jgi:hypothetical protein
MVVVFKGISESSLNECKIFSWNENVNEKIYWENGTIYNQAEDLSDCFKNPVYIKPFN